MDVSSVPVVGALADLFSRTSASSLFVLSSFRSARGVGAARLGHSHCESEGGGYSRVLYWLTATFLEIFNLIIRNKSAIQLRVPHLLSFGVELVLNLHIMLHI